MRRATGNDPARGVRFPVPLKKRVDALSAATQRTFNDSIIFLVLKGLAALDQEEADRAAGERARKAKR